MRPTGVDCYGRPSCIHLKTHNGDDIKRSTCASSTLIYLFQTFIILYYSLITFILSIFIYDVFQGRPTARTLCNGFVDYNSIMFIANNVALLNACRC